MPSDLTGHGRAPRRSGPCITYSGLTGTPEGHPKTRHIRTMEREEFEMAQNQDVARENPGEQTMPPATSGTDDLKSLSPLEQRQALTELVGQGKSDEEIGEEFGLSQWQVRNLRYKLGIKKDRGGNVYLREPEIDLGQHARGQALAPGIPMTEGADGLRGLHISWTGTARADELAGRLEGLSDLLKADVENRPYQIRVEISERG